MSTRIEYTAAERESFALVPETCPAVEAALDKAFRPVAFNEAFAADVFAKYGLQAPDKKTCEAMTELVGRILFMRKRDLQDTVMYEGTFLLRAELVHQIERANGMQPTQNHFDDWIRTHKGSLKYRKPANLEQAA